MIPGGCSSRKAFVTQTAIIFVSNVWIIRIRIFHSIFKQIFRVLWFFQHFKTYNWEELTKFPLNLWMCWRYVNVQSVSCAEDFSAISVGCRSRKMDIFNMFSHVASIVSSFATQCALILTSSWFYNVVIKGKLST